MIRDLSKLFNRKYIYRSAVDGRIVSRAFALLHPTETYAVPRRRKLEPMERFK